VVVVSPFVVKDMVDYFELEYMVSPPGKRHAKMTRMKLKLCFEGRADGNVRIWWNRPQRYRDDDSYKFRLGIIEVMRDLGAYDPLLLSFVGACLFLSSVLPY